MPSQRGPMRDARAMIGPAVEQMTAGFDPAPEDLPLLAIARRQAAVIDAMPDQVAVAMLPNHVGPLIRALTTLAERAEKRRQHPPGRPSKLDELRAARAASDARRRHP